MHWDLFLKHCDVHDRGVGWNGLERAQYLARDAEQPGFVELRMSWTFAPQANDPGQQLTALAAKWAEMFAMEPLDLVDADLHEWRVVHSYFGNDRQDCRSPLMDHVVAEAFVKEPVSYAQVRVRNTAQGLPPISLSAQDGQIMMSLLRLAGARKGVEIGSLGGYSAAWICEAIGPTGMLVTIEKDAKRSRLAAENLQNLGYGDRVECRSGDALQVLKNLATEGPWDFVFIDADKGGYGNYVRWAMEHLRPGGIILADNAYLWGGMLSFPQPWVDAAAHSEAGSRLHGFDAAEYQGMSEAWRHLAESPEFETWMLPVPDGILVARKK